MSQKPRLVVRKGSKKIIAQIVEYSEKGDSVKCGATSSELKKMGWRPALVYLIATIFNTILALIVAWIIFGWLFPVNM